MNLLPGTKKLPHESGRQTVMRVLRDKVGGFEDGNISFDWTRKEYFEEDGISPSYPGVRTVYRKEIYEGRVTAADSAVLARVGLAGGSGADVTLTLVCSRNYSRTYK